MAGWTKEAHWTDDLSCFDFFFFRQRNGLDTSQSSTSPSMQGAWFLHLSHPCWEVGIFSEGLCMWISFNLDLSGPKEGLWIRCWEETGWLCLWPQKPELIEQNIKNLRFRINLVWFFPVGDVQCFGKDCYALAFGVPGLLMLIALGKRSGAKETNTLMPSTWKAWVSTVHKLFYSVLTQTY